MPSMQSVWIGRALTAKRDRADGERLAAEASVA
jgi:hypothetical protein